MAHQITSLILLLLLTCLRGLSQSTPLKLPARIRIEQGWISGAINASGDVHIYKGIPYAAPPIGNLRWKAPQPAPSWKGVRPCVAFGPNAMQPVPVPSGAYGKEILIPPDGPISEDCLYLNVWAPAKKANKKRPVLVIVHGGGFTGGSGSISLLDGEQMARKGLVVVSINYRLGVFGFLAHPALTAESPHHSSGNYGILDQIAAFEWIKKNISAFGGDPDNITADGGSAGSCSVLTIVASPLGKGLLRRVISESGPLFQPKECRELRAAEHEGLQTMQAKQARTLSQMRALSADSLLKGDHLRLPVVDNYLLTDHIRDLFAAGKQNDVDLLIGYNEGDQDMRGPAQSAQAFIRMAKGKYGLDADEFLRIYPASTDQQAAASQVAISRDRVFGWGNFLWAKAQSRQGQQKVWMYYFSRSVPAVPGKPEYGAFHGSQGAYVLDNLHRWNLLFTQWDKTLSERMSTYWVNFATSGNPNIAYSEASTQKKVNEQMPFWPPFSVAQTKVMEFGSEVKPINLPSMRAFRFFEVE
ncbi:carboxylesterase family protein [Rhodocytophaga rosea]|uniref:Carboxylesterase family protein n=1 Tax=Rhodocytophaga rosea TaxID=2704465 RepID=A0A6C0GRS9_9BACT|nr:carboxylesterase family protein [Rhodocytophaga rosea]QHT70791.1 carboxylesterase family protein [Rhodocytophaga rosea]